MFSAAVDIFRAWGEFSPDIEEFNLLIAALVPRDRAPSKKCSLGLVLRVKMSHGFKVVLLGSFRSCVAGEGVLVRNRLAAWH